MQLRCKSLFVVGVNSPIAEFIISVNGELWGERAYSSHLLLYVPDRCQRQMEDSLCG